MIARVWKGWTTLQKADAYEAFLREKVIPGIRNIDGHRGVYVLRKQNGRETEFLVINLFDSLDTVKTFAGENYAVPVFEPGALELLSRIEPRADHYDVGITSAGS